MKTKEFFDGLGDWAQAAEWLMIHLVMAAFLVLAVGLFVFQLLS